MYLHTLPSPLPAEHSPAVCVYSSLIGHDKELHRTRNGTLCKNIPLIWTCRQRNLYVMWDSCLNCVEFVYRRRVWGVMAIGDNIVPAIVMIGRVIEGGKVIHSYVASQLFFFLSLLLYPVGQRCKEVETRSLECTLRSDRRQTLKLSLTAVKLLREIWSITGGEESGSTDRLLRLSPPDETRHTVSLGEGWGPTQYACHLFYIKAVCRSVLF